MLATDIFPDSGNHCCMDKINANSNLRLTQAYSSALRAQAKPAANTFGTVDSRASSVEDQVAISRPERLATSVQRLAAGTVSVPAIEKQPVESVLPQRVSATYTARGTLAMHGQPGDRNAAATGVTIGKMVDISG